MHNLLYVTSDFDRQHHVRQSAEELMVLRESQAVRVLPIWKDLSYARQDDPDHPWLVGDEARNLLAECPVICFLGQYEDHPVFAVDLFDPKMDDEFPRIGSNSTFINLRLQAPFLPVHAGAWMAYARGMIFWHRVNGFCSRCGAATLSEHGGHVRRCSDLSCGYTTYPRTDPAVIMLVERDQQILLHRQAIWPPGMWSCLAGFVEPGETLEAAVRREVKEESGIEFDDVRYVLSQPWPFPSSAMIAFIAKAIGGVLAPALDEIEDARWFSLDDLALFDDKNRQTGQGLFLASPGSAARQLIENWKMGK